MHKIEQTLWDFEHVNHNVAYMITIIGNYMYLYFFQLEIGIHLN